MIVELRKFLRRRRISLRYTSECRLLIAQDGRLEYLTDESFRSLSDLLISDGLAHSECDLIDALFQIGAATPTDELKRARAQRRAA